MPGAREPKQCGHRIKEKDCIRAAGANEINWHDNCNIKKRQIMLGMILDMNR